MAPLRHIAPTVTMEVSKTEVALLRNGQRSVCGDYPFAHGKALDFQRYTHFGKRQLRRSRLSVATTFFLVGFTCTTWAARVSSIRDDLHLSNGQLALALLGFSAGIVIAPLIVGGLVVRLGSRTVLVSSMVWYLAALPLVALAPTLPFLTTAMLLLAIGNCGMDVAMNTQGCLVERAHGRPILSSFHAMFSLGALAGAAIGALAASAGTSTFIHFTTVAIVMLFVAATVMTGLLPDPPGAPRAHGKRSPTPPNPVSAFLLPGVVCFCAMMTESTMNSWSTLYLRDVIGSDRAAAAIGLAAFSTGMVIGRLTADRIHRRFGTRRFLLACSATASLGTAIMLSASTYIICLTGAVVLGLGLSAVVPVVFSHSAARDPERSGSAIAIVTNIGYTGFLTGPPTMGGLAQAGGLHTAMIILLVLMLVMTVLANRLRSDVARAPQSRRP